MATITKAQAQYVAVSPKQKARCALCTMFRPAHDCTLVKGEIAAEGLCKFFERKKLMAKSLAFNTGSEDESVFNFFLPLSKVEKQKDGSCIVAGYASTPTKDLDGEIISLDAVKAALPQYMEWRAIREMHRPSAIGVAKEANVDTKGLFVTSRITDKTAVQKCIDGVYKGYSVGGRKLAKNGDTITEIELVEISLVDRPANSDCRITLVKRAKDMAEGIGGYLIKATKKERILPDVLTRALSTMSEVSEFLVKTGNSPAAHDGLSLSALTKTEKLCKAHNVADCADCKCAKHAMVDCEKCAMKAAKKLCAAQNEFEKRDFSADQRREAASKGEAMPDGSFPIKNEEDLHNAIRLAGNAKDPAAAKKHIKSRAKAMGMSDAIPDTWKSAKKIAKQAQRAAQIEALRKSRAKELALHKMQVSAEPSFLTLTAGGSAATSAHSQGLLPLPSTVIRKDGATPRLPAHLELRKGMGVAARLAYCFDSIRDAQRQLLMEAKQEGGDMKDKGLAQKLGSVASDLAAVIGQKATHEGGEALDLSDADDSYLNDVLGGDFAMTANNGDLVKALGVILKNAPAASEVVKGVRKSLKQARDLEKAASKAIEELHSMHKAAYLAKEALIKAGKKKPSDADEDEFDHAGAMEKMQKAFGALNTSKTIVKAARETLAKAASRVGEMEQSPTHSDRVYEVPPGVHDLSASELATTGPGGAERNGEPSLYPGDGSPYTAERTSKMRKGAYSAVEVEALTRAAAAEAKLGVISHLPAGGRRPAIFNTGMTAGGSNDGANTALFKGVDQNRFQSEDADTHNGEVAKVIGNMIMTPGFGKSLMDPKFAGKTH